MAYDQEVFIKIIKGNAGKNYPCSACDKTIHPREKYTKVNMTSKGSDGTVIKQVKTVCADHDIKTAINCVDI